MGILDKLKDAAGGGGGLLGGLAGKVVDLFNNRIENKAQAAELAAAATTLIATQEHELKVAVLEGEQEFEQEVTKRVQADAQSGDSYTQRTRPMIARQSWFAGCGYIAVSVVTKIASPYFQIEVFVDGVRELAPGPVVELDWGILMAVYSPALTYMGVRTFDKWKRS